MSPAKFVCWITLSFPDTSLIPAKWTSLSQRLINSKVSCNLGSGICIRQNADGAGTHSRRLASWSCSCERRPQCMKTITQCCTMHIERQTHQHCQCNLLTTHGRRKVITLHEINSSRCTLLSSHLCCHDNDISLHMLTRRLTYLAKLLNQLPGKKAVFGDLVLISQNINIGSVSKSQ